CRCLPRRRSRQPARATPVQLLPRALGVAAPAGRARAAGPTAAPPRGGAAAPPPGPSLRREVRARAPPRPTSSSSPLTSPSPSGRAVPGIASAHQRHERVVALDQLIRLRPDDTAGTFQLTVEQQAANLLRFLQKRRQRRACQALCDVASRTRERAPDRTHRRIARPHEEGPAPVPAAAEILGLAAARGRSPEEHEVTGGEGLRGVGERRA